MTNGKETWKWAIAENVLVVTIHCEVVLSVLFSDSKKSPEDEGDDNRLYELECPYDLTSCSEPRIKQAQDEKEEHGR